MDKKNWIIVFLLCVNALTICLYFSYKKSTNIIVESLKPYVNGYNDLKSNLIFQIENNQYKINDLVLMDSVCKEFSISDLFDCNTKEIIFCRISDRFCKGCNEYVVNIAKKISPSTVFLVNQTESKKFYNIKETYKLPDKTFAINEIGFPIESLMEPFLFVLNNELKTSIIYIPQSGNISTDYQIVKSINERIEKQTDKVICE